MDSLHLLTQESRGYCGFLFYRWRGPPVRLELGKCVSKAAGEDTFRGLSVSGLWEAVRGRPNNFEKVLRKN